MAGDRLAGRPWECAATPPGAAGTPDDLAKLSVTWWPVAVPGTAAAALRDAPGLDADGWDPDRLDWWFRTSFDAPAGRHLLSCEGLATVAEVWCNGEPVLESASMFRRHDVEVVTRDGANELAVRFCALGPVLAERRPRARWPTYLVPHRNLRWVRTTLMGRTPGWTLTPAPVGPWRPVRLHPAGTPVVTGRRVAAACDGAGGTVTVRLEVWEAPAGPARLDLDGASADLRREETDSRTVLTGTARLATVARWWPATHGDQPRYPLAATVGGDRVELSPVGFRTVELDTDGGAFALAVNGVEVFCRGAVWWPTDPTAAGSPPAEMRATLEAARAGHANMLRVSGMGVYEPEAFWAACDELGLLVWQDCMLAFTDPPDDGAFGAEVAAELADHLGTAGGHPALAVLCGSQQVHEQAAMVLGGGAPPSRLLDEVLPAVATELAPGVPYVASCPTGGRRPFHADTGPSHYYGVGSYLRRPADVRRDGVRFAAECLFMATPPEPEAVEAAFGPATETGHGRAWKAAVHFDPGRAWDHEDIQAHYAREVFGADLAALRPDAPERSLEVARATNAALVTALFSEWRRPGSPCRGGLVLGLRDQRTGSGWGLLDAAGHPKATWWALRRASAPLALLVTDEGLAGLAFHLVNDTDVDVAGTLVVRALAQGTVVVSRGERPVRVPARDGLTVPDTEVDGGIWDLAGAYRFGRPEHDAVVATLVDAEGRRLAGDCFFPGGPARPVLPDLGLRAGLEEGEHGWTLLLETDRLAQWVVPTLPGYRTDDAWFHLPPGEGRRLGLTPLDPEAGPPRGSVRAFNCSATVPVRPSPPRTLPPGDDHG